MSDDAVDETGASYPTHYEAVAEISYQATINDHIVLQPDFQFVFNPGAVHRTRDAVVAGFRLSYNF